jgi:hypothetical protein
MVSSQAFSQKDFNLRNRPGTPQQYSVFSTQDLKQIERQGATLEAINSRLSAIDENLKSIRGTLDKDVLPTIHVMDFFKWLFAGIAMTVIGVVANHWYKNRPHSTTS